MSGPSLPARGAAFWLPLLAWCALIFVLSGVPNLDLPHVTPWLPWGARLDYPLRKLAHVSEYFVLYLLAHRGWPARKAWVFCVLYAASDELHQYFVPGRACRFSDVCLDSAAAALAAYLPLSRILRRC